MEQSLLHAARAGLAWYAHEATARICASYVFGPTPVPAALERVEEIRAQPGIGAIIDSWSSVAAGRLRAMDGVDEVEVARGLVRSGRQTIREAGLLLTAAGMALSEGNVEWHAGDFASEERILRQELEELRDLGDTGFASTVAANLALCLYRQGRLEEAEAHCALARELTSADDVVNFVIAHAVEAELSANAGRHADAERQIAKALELVETTDFYDLHSKVHVLLAETHQLAGRSAEAVAAAAKAISFCEVKQDVVGELRVRERIEKVGIEVG